MSDIDLSPLPEYLKEMLARLAARDLAAIEIALESLGPGSRHLLVMMRYVAEDEEGKLLVTDRTRALLAAAQQWYRATHEALSEQDVARLEAGLFGDDEADEDAQD